jgi:arylsulfatase A
MGKLPAFDTTMKKPILIILTLLFASFAVLDAADKSQRPNILIIYADDLGYGDLGCYNPESKIPTPNIDKLAKEGMRFTDAHSPATTCTPSRYGLLTGKRPIKIGAYTSPGRPCFIKKDQLTLPGMLREKGYRTALFGKWHIGMTFFDKDGNRITKGNNAEAIRKVDFTRAIPDSPIHRGFDEFFGTNGCPTSDWMYTYIDGDRVTEVPTILMDEAERKGRNLPDNKYSGFRKGLATEDFDFENIDLLFLEKSQDFLKRHKEKSPDKPFFLVHCTQAPHNPAIPALQYRGKTDAGPYGDFIFELDDIVGKLMNTLDQLGYAKNTLVLFSSDNGPERAQTVYMRKDHQHDPARPWRGFKRDNWEAGHRVPFIARWPKKIKEGQVSNQIFKHTDFMATCAAIVDYDLPNNAAEDSYNMLPALYGEKKPIRDYVLQRGSIIRKGKWKYLAHKGSGGNKYQGLIAEYILEEKAPNAPGQLYDLEKDPGETNNLYFEYPELVRELSTQLKEFVKSGRSAPLR